MRQSRLIQHVMLGVAVATLGCAGSRLPHRQNLARVPMTPPQASEQFYSPAPVASPPAAPPAEPELVPPLDEQPTPLLTPEPGEIPPPPSFEQGGLPAPPMNEPLTASNSKTGLRRLKVPPKLQPITWKTLYPGKSDKSRNESGSTSLQERFGHSLR